MQNEETNSKSDIIGYYYVHNGKAGAQLPAYDNNYGVLNDNWPVIQFASNNQ